MEDFKSVVIILNSFSLEKVPFQRGSMLQMTERYCEDDELSF